MTRHWFKRRTPLAPDPRLGIAAAEAIRAIEGQQDNLDNLRARVGILLSAATIATSFLGGIALSGDRSLTVPGYVAVVLFIGHLGCGMFLLWPRGWRFQTSAQYMVEDWIDNRHYDEDTFRRRLIYWSDHHVGANGKRLNRLWGWYAAAIVLLGAEIIAWILDIGGFQGWLYGVICP